MRGAKFVAWTIFPLVAGVTVAGAPCTWESALQIEIDHASAHFGEAIPAGDVDGDGYNDVVVGAPSGPNGSGIGQAHSFTVPVTVPEPPTILLLLTGLAGLGMMMCRRV